MSEPLRHAGVCARPRGRRPGPRRHSRAARRSAHGVELGELHGTGPRGRITRADVLRGRWRHVPATVIQLAPRQPGGGSRQSLQPAVEAVDARPAGDRPADDRVQGDDPRVRGADRGRRWTRCSSLRDGAARAGSARDRCRRSTTLDRQGLRRSRCATIRASTAPSSTAASTCTRGSTSGSPSHAAGALIVPDVHDADEKSLGAIAAETRRLAERVRSGEITPHELSGATFTVSNLGMYGMTAIRPVINPPQVAILGVGAIRGTSRPGRRRDRRTLADDAHPQRGSPSPVRRRRSRVPLRGAGVARAAAPDAAVAALGAQSIG